MKLYNKKYTTLFALFIVAVSSCNKYLDKKSNATLVTPSTLADMQALLDYTEIMNMQRTPSYSMITDDEYFLNNDEYNALGDAAFEDAYIWKSNYEENSGNDWSTCYQPIYNANLVLDLIGDITKTSSNANSWNNIKGSALFYRSYYFLQLLWNYTKAFDSLTADNDLGIALRLTSDFNVPSTRATNKECYEQVIKDTKSSIPLLPDYPQLITRPSKDAAYGLLARCYLSMRDYRDALLYADSCLQLNNQLMNYNGDDGINGSISSSTPFLPYNKEEIFYTEISTYNYFYLTSVIGSIDTTLITLYETNDLRLTAFYNQNADGYLSFKGTYSKDISMFSGIAVDEMYLTRAECYIRMGQVQKGLDDINTLLSKRYKTGTYIPLTGLSQSDALTKVLQERKKELVMRGLRWMDIKRLNKEGKNIILKRVIGGQTYTLSPNASFYALPLPGDIIQITGMPQNPD